LEKNIVLISLIGLENLAKFKSFLIWSDVLDFCPKEMTLIVRAIKVMKIFIMY
jgi:hypothetical protein